MSQSNDSWPVTVSGPLRFAVIAPGQPYPNVIASSDEGVADLVGYYSLREIGVDPVALNQRPETTLMSELLFPSQRRELEASSFDVWVNEPDDVDGRTKLYSVVVESAAFASNQRITDYIRKPLENQVLELSRAWKIDDVERGKYTAGIISALTSKVVEEFQYSRLNRARRRDLLRKIFILYIFIVVFGVLAGLTVQYISPQIFNGALTRSASE